MILCLSRVFADTRSRS